MFTNQMVCDLGAAVGERLKSVGGSIMRHGPQTQLFLQFVDGKRSCEVDKSPCLPPGTAQFAILKNGVGDIYY